MWNASLMSTLAIVVSSVVVATVEYPTCEVQIEDVVDTSIYGTGKLHNDVPLI